MVSSKSTNLTTVYRSRRRALLRAAARQVKIDAMLVTNPADVGYLTGFSGDDSFALLIGDKPFLLTDGRYDEQAAKECPGVEMYVRTGKMSLAVADVLRGKGVRRVGVQREHVTLALHKALSDALGKRKLIELSNLAAGSRETKDDIEVRAIRKALRIAEKAFLELIAGGAKRFLGRTERQIAAQLDHRMRDLGAEAPFFETIVAVGPNGSRPHHRPGSRRVKRGDPILLDWGARLGGYGSDLTRVVFTGTIPPEFTELYTIVLSAQKAGIRSIQPGKTCKSVDRAARSVIEAAGYGEKFVHSLGHGLGRDVHEAPTLTKTNPKRLRAGMIVTVEPGIYIPGVGGIRVEDDVLVTSRGAKRLSRLPRDIEAMRLR
ncbi:MAG: aminopeptidase P family protein [Phycisphaerae bacterium]|nr:aminopeptidase P family protein [Phycisphaerae bacterium]